MRSQMMHCPVLNHSVELLVTRAEPSDAASERKLCIGVERRCTGRTCPLCDVSPDVLRAEMDRIGVLCGR
jgi:hypothetical protein